LLANVNTQYARCFARRMPQIDLCQEYYERECYSPQLGLPRVRVLANSTPCLSTHQQTPTELWHCVGL